MTRPSKARIQASFAKAAATYDSAAALQRAVCHRLLTGLSPARGGMLPSGLRDAATQDAAAGSSARPSGNSWARSAADLTETRPTAHGDARPLRRWLDAGCGTGYALPLLQAHYPDAQAIALDLAPPMLQRIATPCCRLAGDLEHLPLADASLDLYWSSLAVQWCDLGRSLGEAHRVLTPGGRLALATLGPATFHELRAAFSAIDPHRHTLSFHKAAEVAEAARKAGFTTVDVQDCRETVHYPDLRSLLRAVKAVGANQVGDGRRSSLLGRSAFARLEAAYETRRSAAGLPLTYDVITLHCLR